jgi:hypothetical protein
MRTIIISQTALRSPNQISAMAKTILAETSMDEND